ncbi:hypothetical protein EZS27_023909 [termite gut metagenome]|uniref:Uncharacterized protein n=1 Tax=termite gut metagenome TaxID=433724 RepID=A0A5J4QYP6_9ZZZZ
MIAYVHFIFAKITHFKMKESLKKFVESILFSAEIEENVSFDVYKIGIDNLPDFTNELQISSGIVKTPPYYA